MAERISGLSIDLSMDTAELSRSFTSIKDSFRDIKRSAQVNLNNIKFDDKSVDTYRKNVNELSKSFDNQKKNVDDLRKHYDKMAATHGETSKEAQSARIEYNKQADELNKLGHAVENARTELHKLNVENSGFTKIGNAAETAGSGIQTFGGHVKDVGGSLTKWITAPVLGAITAAGGLTAAFGWGRLVGLDNAKAQLEGMGYSLEEVDDITGQVSDAIQGGMMTMAEGTSVAAGAMAAGVEQGDELAKYLQLVDAAAVGANKPVGDMAMIFNRVQGSGKLMTQELNMIEDSMPGFSAAMAENAGVTMEEFRKMVTDGEITSNDFITVMDTFAGGMAEAHADTWQGMVANTKANIGILGESMLSGVFEQSKESIREFLDLLRSDSFRTWATEAGETIGTVFTSIVDKVRTGVQWFTSLSDEQKKMIGIFSAVAVAAGPLLMAFGSIAIFVGGVVKAIAPLFLGLGKLSTAFTAVRTGAMTFGLAFPKLAGFFAILTGPIGITIAAITALGAGFVIAYNKSETFRNFIGGLKDKFMGAWESAMEFKDKVVQAISGVTAMFTGDWLGGRTILQKLGMSEEQILGVENTVLKVRKFFHDMKEKVNSALSEVGTFFRSIFTDMKDWWDTDGALIFSAIKTTISTALTFVVDLFNRFKPIVLGIWNAVFPVMHFIIKMVWEKIKLVVGIGMDVIQGIISSVSALIEGDWSRFGQILKETALSIWNKIKEYFTNMKNNTLTIFGDLFSGAVQWFVDMYENLKQRAEFIKTVVVYAFNQLKDQAIEKVVGMFKSIVQWFVDMYENLKTRAEYIKTVVVYSFTALKNEAVRRIVEMYNSVKKWFSDLWTTVKNTVTNLKNNVVNLFVNMKDGAIDGVRKLYTGAKNLFNDVKDYAKDTFTNMVDGAKELPGKLGRAISNGAGKAVDGVKKLGNRMARGLGKVVNGVIGGLNSITSKIGIDTKITEWNVPTFSTGTGQGSPSGKLTKNGKIAMDTLATVGDKGKGNGSGTRELVHYPNGKVGLYDNDATIFAPKGTTIFSNRETEAMLGQLPKFSEGTGLWASIKNIASKAVDYITNPKKIFDDLISAVGENFGDMTGFAGNFIKGAWNMIKDGMFGWIKDKFSEASVGKSQKWMDYKMTTPYSPNAPVPGYPTSFNGGRHYGIDYGTPTGVNITSPMAGTVSRMSDRGGGNVARLDAAGNAAQYFMHMNSVKTGKVGIGDSVGRSGNTGEWTTGPHVHWQHEDPSASYVQNRNTKNPLSMIKGHLKGGQILSDGLFNLHKGEYVINPNEPTEAMKLLAIVGKKLAGKSKQTREIASVPGTTGNDELLDKMQQQIDLLTQLVMSSKNIEAKELKVGDNQIGQANDRYSARQSSRQSVKTGRISYV